MKRRRTRPSALFVSLKRKTRRVKSLTAGKAARKPRGRLAWALGLALRPFGGRVASALRGAAARMTARGRGKVLRPTNLLVPFIGGARAPLTRWVPTSPAVVLPEILARSGWLAVRLAKCPADIAAAQQLRYQVFYEEMSARPTPEMAATRHDVDRFDAICDILLVTDEARPEADRVVGTYRLLRQDVAEANGGFYSETEYDLTAIRRLFSDKRRGLELGRSCVHRDYRNNACIQLLWRGIASYVAAHRVGWMFGCASLPGTDPDALAAQLSLLHHNFRAPSELRARARPELYVAMDRLPAGGLNEKRVLQSLPPLIKGYLRVGGVIGEGAVVDRQFGTTDVFVLVAIDKVPPRYLSHFDKNEQIQAAIGHG